MNIDKLKKPFVLILVGPPLSGKSTWIKKNFTDDEVNIICRDNIVLDVYGSDDYDKAFKNVDQKRVDGVLEKNLRNSVKNGDNVIVDMTNLTSKRRKHTLTYFDDTYQKVAVIFPPVDWDEMQRRNDKRKIEENKTISDHVIKNMLSSYQPVRQQAEGFDKIVSL